MDAIIRPSADIRNHYNKISRQCREERIQPRYATLCRQGYLVLIGERNLVFYKVTEKDKKLVIYAVVDDRREYKNMV